MNIKMICRITALAVLISAGFMLVPLFIAVGVGMHFVLKGFCEGKGKHEYCQYANG